MPRTRYIFCVIAQKATWWWSRIRCMFFSYFQDQCMEKNNSYHRCRWPVGPWIFKEVLRVNWRHHPWEWYTWVRNIEKHHIVHQRRLNSSQGSWMKLASIWNNWLCTVAVFGKLSLIGTLLFLRWFLGFPAGQLRSNAPLAFLGAQQVAMCSAIVHGSSPCFVIRLHWCDVYSGLVHSSSVLQDICLGFYPPEPGQLRRPALQRILVWTKNVKTC